MGVPVHIHHPSFFRPLPFSVSCVPCLPSPLPFPQPHPHTPPTLNQASRYKALLCPMKTLQQVSHQIRLTCLRSLRAAPKLCPRKTLQQVPQQMQRTCWRSLRAAPTYSPYEDTRASSARKLSAPHTLKKSEGFTLHDPFNAQLRPCHAVSSQSFRVWLGIISRRLHHACILPRPIASPFTLIPHHPFYPSLSRREDMDSTSSWFLVLLCKSAGPVCLNCCVPTLLSPIQPHST